MLAFFYSIFKAVIVALIVKLTLFKNKKKWLEENPNVKYRIDFGFYIFNKYVYYPTFSIGFAIYGVSVTLFEPDYDVLPRFIAAWIAFGTGLIATILFKYINRNYTRPTRPI